jgi:hypothetical protein
MKRLCLLGLAAVIASMQVDQIPAFARGGHGGHGHGGHRSHGHGGHGHRGHAHAGHARTAHHAGHTRGVRHHAAAHRHVGPHNRHHAGHHAAWSHHYANHWHNWGYHHGWGYNHGWANHHAWGWGGWNWYGGGVNVVGPSVVNPGYIAAPAGPNVVVVPGSNVNGPLPPGGQGFFSVLGTISTIKGNTVSVAPEDGDPVTIDTTPDTTVVLNSQQSSLADLQPSDRVKARYDKDLKAMTLVAVRK